MVQNHDFYDFEAKYLAADDVRLETPADLPDDVAERIRQMAAAAFDAAGCEGLARVDFFLTAHGEILVNEINTMPGFTPSSMYPRMWAATGMTYPDLIDDLIALALERQRQRTPRLQRHSRSLRGRAAAASSKAGSSNGAAP